MKVAMKVTGGNIAIEEMIIAHNQLVSTSAVRKVFRKALVPASREAKKLARRIENKDGKRFKDAANLSKAIKYKNGKVRKRPEVRLVVDQSRLPVNANWHGRRVSSAQWQEHGTGPGIGENRDHHGRIQGKYFMYKAFNRKRPEIITLINSGVKELFIKQNAKSKILTFS